MPTHSAEIELNLLPQGRQVRFSKEMLEIVDVYRRLGPEGAPWARVAANARSPYLDTEALPAGTEVAYYVQHFAQDGTPGAGSNIVLTTVG